MFSYSDDLENNLVCIIKCGEIVLATEVVPVVQSKIRQDADCTYVEFPDTITVPDVTSDFKIRVEVYNLVVDKKDTSCVKNKDKVETVCSRIAPAYQVLLKLFRFCRIRKI